MGKREGGSSWASGRKTYLYLSNMHRHFGMWFLVGQYFLRKSIICQMFDRSLQEKRMKTRISSICVLLEAFFRSTLDRLLLTGEVGGALTVQVLFGQIHWHGKGLGALAWGRTNEEGVGGE